MTISQKHKGFKIMVGDASNPTFGIAVDETSHAMHICDATDAGTDWSVSADSDPSVYIHCADANAATDYLKLYHNDTNGIIDCDGTTMLTLTASTLAIANATTITTGGLAISAGGAAITGAVDVTGTLNVMDGNVLWVGVEATPGTTAGQNWIGIEDGGVDPAGTLTNALAIYTPDAGDSLDFLHADGTTDSLGT